MTEYIKREDALSALKTARGYCPCAYDEIKRIPAADVAEVRHGRWIKKHRHRGGFRRVTGVDDMGETHTVTVDERVEYDDLYCSKCGKQSADNCLNYCPNCGAKMDEVTPDAG